jgi:RNA polymerase sigma-70 factor, ECF subfamily
MPRHSTRDFVNPAADSYETNRVLERAAQGDRSALGSLLTDYEPYLKRLVELRLDPGLRARVDAADVVQEVHLALSRALPKFMSERPLSFKLWLRQLALDQISILHRRHLQTQKRAASREVQLSEMSSLALANSLLGARPSRIASQRELIDLVQRALAELLDNDREVLLLRHFEELSNVEIAALLDIDPASVSQRYGRAIRRLCRKLDGRDPAAPE